MSSSKRTSLEGKLRIKPEKKTPLRPAVGANSGNRESAKSHLVKIGVQVDQQLYFELKKQAVSKGVKLYEELNAALAKYLGRED